ncbi:PREDICTED: uncharacterized protein LOC109347580 isoform X2 [Lupinus angustifolius]|uniref:uncharacterized protein LOC109347580 isoform X2 n=1 Tax=Lupinus angustifolius TaxID=3871 RepID=UPI00092E88B6|nr:PREDICTED: uncharacterized protein LOC109347580 isoform X2 [Lupinus angustifolius]
MVIPETETFLNVDDHNRRLSLIDFSNADDSLIAIPFYNHQQQNSGLSYTSNYKKLKLQEWEWESQPNETHDFEESVENSKYNMRNSLAWDSAFFTSAGVLDPEELRSIIEGADKNEKCGLWLLPRTVDDTHKSCDSISTIESDGFTMESLEADLFDDVRASIENSEWLSNVVSPNSKVPSTGGHSSKMVGLASRNKMKTLSFKTPSAVIQRTGKMTKKNLNFPQLPKKPVAIWGERSVLKQPKVLGLGKSSSSSKISSKLASPGDLHVKSEKGKVSSVSNASVIMSSRASVPKSTLPSKFPSVPSVSLKTKSTISKSPGGNISGNISKSTISKRPLSSCSSAKSLSKLASRDKTASSGSSVSSLLSVSKLSSSISPASSISDCSLDSPSSTSMSKYRCNSSMATIGSSSSRKRLSDVDGQQMSKFKNARSNSSLEGKETRHTGFSSQGARIPAAELVLPQAPMNTSGLRLPSPTIGFFGGVKSSVGTPGRGTQRSGMPHSLPKHGARNVNPSEGQKNAKHRKLKPARYIMSTENKKSSNQQTSHPIPLHESSDDAIGTSTLLQNVKIMEVQTYHETGTRNLEVNNAFAEGNLAGIHDLNLACTWNDGTLDNSIEIICSDIKGSIHSDETRETCAAKKLNSRECVENTSSSKVAGDCLKAEDRTLINHDFGNHTSNMCTTENKEVHHISMGKMSPEGNIGMHPHNNGATITNADHNPCVSNATENLGNTSPSHVVEKAPEFCQHDLKDNQDKLHDDQVDCLSKQVILLDINLDTKKLKSDSPFSQPDFSFQDKSNDM